MNAHINKAIADKLTQIATSTATAKALIENAEKIDEALAPIEKLAEHNPDVYITYSAWSKTFHIEVTIYTKTPTLKKGPAQKARIQARRAGLTPTDATDYTSQYSASRTWKFSQDVTTPDVNVKLQLSIIAELKEGDEATCRKIQIGTKTEEVPIYKIVCD